MRLQILATATLLTATISLAAPIKAEMASQSVNLNSLPAATDIQSTSYDPYPFGTVDKLELRTDNGGVNCSGQVQLNQDSKEVCAPSAKPSDYMTTVLANLVNGVAR